MAFDIYRNKDKKKLELQYRLRKCLFLYHYWIDDQFGWMSARIQSWLPFPIQICLNGREWLSRMMDRNGMSYRRDDNCFPWDRRFSQSPEVDETAVAHFLAQSVGARGAPTQPGPLPDVSWILGSLLLVCLSERMGRPM